MKIAIFAIFILLLNLFFGDINGHPVPNAVENFMGFVEKTLGLGGNNGDSATPNAASDVATPTLNTSS